ncbi:UDP-N-acetylglucosamine 2-epimerase (non-hydrolyzing) [Candidatus Woesearchaeota archaeon]|nr:UDP-N-acetylglucosamine 2-epimerase (non-hydrolyzing) [Candidatus Woesearchaeota archaeon]
MKLAIVLGTRPEIIKLASIIAYCEENEIDYRLIHTNQHYNYELDKIFFEELHLPAADYSLGAGSKSHAKQVAEMISKIEDVFLREKPDCVIVQGDTNSVLAGGLTAAKMGIKVAHVEAGLRSFDRHMPEEINRIIVDSISDILLPPTDWARRNLLREGISKKKIFVTGNTIVDALNRHIKLAEKKEGIFLKHRIKKNNYFLVTIHRRENTEYPKKIEDIFSAFDLLYKRYETEFLFPAHPRTLKFIEDNNIIIPKGLSLIKPVGYLDFLNLEKNAKLILTDSGGMQEEACILKVPCVTLRENTERPETLEAGSNVLAGTGTEKIIKCVEKMISTERNWKNPFGDGKSGERAVNTVKEFLS